MPNVDSDDPPPTPASTDASQRPGLPLDSLAHRLLEARLLRRLVGDEGQLVKVDRFVIERELGAGGMGTIYSAWDEQLQRRVALKFLHQTGTDAASEQRLFREAQALAQLSHPNVVPIFDVGRHEGRVWLAMEHIPGQTLRDWAKERPRSQAERLEAWMAAGRGLAGIHAAGLVHRDIKPANVMLGEDGRVRIVDFGLVRIANASGPGSSETGLSTAAGWAEGLTEPDRFVGTPAYAAPEQLTGEVIDARSDQFSFCVSLWEALCGRRPSRARGPDGRPERNEGERLPARIHRALSRGLALAPQDRFEDMHALLAALAPPRRRWLVPSVVGSGAALLGLAIGMMALREPAAVVVDPCAQAGAKVDETWTAQSLQPLRATLSEPAIERTQALLDGWVEGWRHAARETCEDVHVRQQRSPESLDRRGVCLDRRLAGLTALRAAIDSGQLTKDEQLVAWLGELEDPRDCLSESVLGSNIEAVAPAHADEVAQVRRDLVRVQLDRDRQSFAARIAEAKQLLSRARVLDWPPLRGEAALALGRLHTIAGDGAAARLRLGEALDAGDRVHDLELQAHAWSALNQVERLVELDVERARWARERHAAVFMVFEPSPRQRAQLVADQGMTQELAGELEEAESSLREALALLEREGPTAAWEQATVLRNLGNLLVYSGRATEGRGLFDRARDLELGAPLEPQARRPAPSEAARALDEGIAMIAAGDPEAAVAQLQRTLTTATQAHGPRSELVARVHVALTAAYDYLGQTDMVRMHAELADSISMEALGPSHPLRVDVLSAVGVSAYHDGRTADAVLAFERALQLVRRVKPADSIAVALAEHNLADALHRDGQDEHAEPLLGHAVPILERQLGSADPRVTDARALHQRLRSTTAQGPRP